MSVLDDLLDRGLDVPEIEEREALERVEKGLRGGYHWDLVRAAVREANAYLTLSEALERRSK